MLHRTNRLAALAVGLLIATTVAASPASAKQVRSAFPSTMLGQPLQGEITNYVNGPTVLGLQSCDPVNNPDASLARARWTASYFDGSNSLDQMSADATVSTWRDAGQAFADVVGDTGRCAFGEGVTRLPWAGQDPATHALFSDGSDAAAVVRDGRHVVAVDVMDWNGDGEAGDEDQVALAAAEALALAQAL